MKAGIVLKRRGLLALAAAGGAALASRVSPAAAASGDAILLGEVNIANRETVLSSSSSDRATLRVSTGSQIALLAQNGDAIDFGEVEAAMLGVSSKGAGIIAAAPRRVGRALEVRGRVAFAGAGTIMIPDGAASWSVFDVYVPEGALILGQLQGYGGPQASVRYCVRLDDTSFRVQLSHVTTQPVKLAFFIFEQAPTVPNDKIKPAS